jgi:TolB-like protein/DNA-binding winged helix-turn-helix (wHTH) protein/tetratricopeptide (TPR) repeat protein
MTSEKTISNGLGNGSPAKRRVQFGVFEVDLRNAEIRRRGAKIRLQEKPFQLLVLLLERAGDITTRKELRRGLWPADTFVDFDANLKTTVNKLRQALGDSAENPVFIETIPRRGYRFLAPVSFIEESRGISAPEQDSTVTGPQSSSVRSSVGVENVWTWRHLAAAVLSVICVGTLATYLARPKAQHTPASSPGARRAVLIVLPFDNLSGDPSQEYFSDGLTDEMIVLFGRQYPQSLAVIARTSAMQFKAAHKSFAQVSREVGGVDYVLEGSVRRSGTHVAINAQLFRVQDQVSLWAETYEREVSDVLAIQHDVAGQIAHSLVLKLTSAPIAIPPAPPDPKVYDAYLMGVFEANKRSEDSIQKSIRFFEQAIQGDPTYAPAYAGLANSYLLSAGWLIMSPAEAYPKARDAALRAVALDENLAEAHTTLAEVRHEYEWLWADAEREFRRGVELNPNSAIAHKSYAEFLMHDSRNAEAIAEMERARDLDPLSLIDDSLLGFVYMYAGQNERAIQECEKVIQLDPQFAPGHYFISGALMRARRYDEAISHLQTAKNLTNGASLIASGLAGAYARSGRRAQALRELHGLQERGKHAYVSPYGLAQVYADLGDNRAALDMLERAATEHAFELMFLRVDQSFLPLHDDARFQQLLKKIGFSV